MESDLLFGLGLKVLDFVEKNCQFKIKKLV
jgi:hypothetical protein